MGGWTRTGLFKSKPRRVPGRQWDAQSEWARAIIPQKWQISRWGITLGKICKKSKLSIELLKTIRASFSIYKCPLNS